MSNHVIPEPVDPTYPPAWVSIGRNAWKPTSIVNIRGDVARIRCQGETYDVLTSVLIWEDPYSVGSYAVDKAIQNAMDARDD